MLRPRSDSKTTSYVKRMSDTIREKKGDNADRVNKFNYLVYFCY